MKANEFYQFQPDPNPIPKRVQVVAQPKQKEEITLASSSEEVARRAYFTYLAEGSRQGCDVQHWLQAEAELIAERNLTRTHGYHHGK